jgi:hypothetical protein
MKIGESTIKDDAPDSFGFPDRILSVVQECPAKSKDKIYWPIVKLWSIV